MEFLYYWLDTFLHSNIAVFQENCDRVASRIGLPSMDIRVPNQHCRHLLVSSPQSAPHRGSVSDRRKCKPTWSTFSSEVVMAMLVWNPPSMVLLFKDLNHRWGGQNKLGHTPFFNHWQILICPEGDLRSSLLKKWWPPFIFPPVWFFLLTKVGGQNRFQNPLSLLSCHVSIFNLYID